MHRRSMWVKIGVDWVREVQAGPVLTIQQHLCQSFGCLHFRAVQPDPQTKKSVLAFKRKASTGYHRRMMHWTLSWKTLNGWWRRHVQTEGVLLMCHVAYVLHVPSSSWTGKHFNLYGCLFIYLLIYLFVIYLFIYLLTYLLTYLHIYLFIYLFFDDLLIISLYIFVYFFFVFCY